jgi:hypothetical protein
VLRAEGRETRGQGGASATITATLEPDGDGTKVVVVTDLTVTGKVAQFGRGVLADVSSKLLGQFVECLESKVLAGDEPAPAAEQPAQATAEPVASPVEPPVVPAVRRIESAPAKPVDLVEAAGVPVVKRAAPIAVVLAVLWLLRLFLKRRKR